MGVALAFPAVVCAMPPAPPNDAPADAEIIGPGTPVLVYGTTVLADDSITTTDLPGLEAYVDGPDVFYSFTPDASDTYRVQLMPWQHAPLRSSDRRFTIYIGTDFDTTPVFIAGARASASAKPVHFDVALTLGTQYFIGVDHDNVTHDNFQFTLLVDTLPATIPDDCASAITLPSTTPVVVLHDIDGASADFLFEQSDGRCSVAQTTTAPGIDHVYYFSPDADGDYAIELVAEGFPAIVYVDDSCGPFFPDGCLGASRHSTGGGGKHELVVVTLEADKDYWVFVDNDSDTIVDGSYTLIIDDAFNYEINEIEPNDTALDATPVDTPLNGGQLVGPEDEDWWAVTGLTGDRVYAWVNNGGSANSTLDTDLGFYQVDGTTLIEFDDEDGDGADAPIEDLRYIYSTTSAVIAGAAMPVDGTHYYRVTDQSATGTVHRYRFHVGVEPATRNPLQECEPNGSIELADYTGKHYYAGVIDTTDDADFFAFDATVGDRVFLAFDGDPERDADGFIAPNDDPKAFHGKMVVYDPAGDILISDISDSNSIQSGPDYPAQGGFFIARTTGTHYVEVMPQSTSSNVGDETTYELAIFLNDAAPTMTDETDPILTLTPDPDNDLINGQATDNDTGDTGVCDVYLVGSTNLVITNLSALPAATATFDIELINPAEGGLGKVVVIDCAGNTACALAHIDVNAPQCSGSNYSKRTPYSLHDPIHVPDNDATVGIDGEIEVGETGTISDVNVTITIETLGSGNIDCWLESPLGTRVELMTDRGTSTGVDITDATFDDDAEEIFPTYSGTPPYTGTWLPEDPLGLAQLNGENAQGTWKLNVRDDYSSPSGGSRLVRWSLDLAASFGPPEGYAGSATDSGGMDSGIASVVLSDPVNVELNLPPEFLPGDESVAYTVTLIDPAQNGSGTVTVSDFSENTCVVPITLLGFTDSVPPGGSGAVTTDLEFSAEVQANLPIDDETGATSSIMVSDSLLIGEVEVDLTVDTTDVGRMTTTLTHGGTFASLLNRTGMDERFSVGLTKDVIEVSLDDDAPAADDTHMEPALGSEEFFGLHQPDGRGDFIYNGITPDKRDNMLFALAGVDSAGQWDLHAADYRPGYATTSGVAILRRWAMTIKNPCAADRYVGTATDFYPGSGICSIELAAGYTNLTVEADFTPGDELVDYVVTLVDPELPGSGTLEITDCATNVTTVPITLSAEGDDQSPPGVGGIVNPVSHEFAGTASDNEVDDTGIETVDLAPYADNLEIISMAPDPPNGADNVSFVIALVDPLANGRGYVRVIDGCGLRGYALVEIDAMSPVCTGSVGHTMRYLSTDLPQDIPDSSAAGVSSSIVVTDTDTVEDVNITFNILHPNAMDIDMTLTSPSFIDLFSDRGSTGNNFIDTTLDDEAAEVIPSSYSAAPFTGSWQPETGSLSTLDGFAATGTYTLKVVDDYNNYTGTFENWALTIESATFPPRYDGRAEDSGAHSSGICSVDFVGASTNVALVADPFTPGVDLFVPDLQIVRYSVELIDEENYGEGVVRVTDCLGNYCDTVVCLEVAQTKGDLDNNGTIDLLDYDGFATCMTGPTGSCWACGDPCKLADFDDDCDVDLLDFVVFAEALAAD